MEYLQPIENINYHNYYWNYKKIKLIIVISIMNKIKMF